MWFGICLLFFGELFWFFLLWSFFEWACLCAFLEGVREGREFLLDFRCVTLGACGGAGGSIGGGVGGGGVGLYGRGVQFFF